MSFDTEDQLRDKLAEDIQVLEPGLRLIDKEAYLPHPLGTRSFVDLLAFDHAKKYVLIELKRSAEASREAIHEVYKYIEAAKAHLGARDDQLRVIVASRDWKELLLPFSRFATDTSISIRGLALNVRGTGDLEATVVEPLPITRGAYLAPWHDLNLYYDTESLNRGIREYEANCRARNIQDYVLIVLKATPGFTQQPRSQTIRALLSALSGNDAAARSAGNKSDHYEYILYFAMRMLNRIEGLALIRNPSEKQEIEETFESSGEEDGLRYMHEVISSMEPRPHRDWYEIGYAAKFRTRLLQDEGWAVEEVRRYGVFDRNAALSDDAIVAELGGAEGSSNQSLKQIIATSDPAQFRALQQKVSECLRDNVRWRSQILHVLNEIRSDLPSSTIDVNVFNPSSGLITIFLTVTRGLEYMPEYSMRASTQTTERLYLGFLDIRPSSITFSDVLKQFYDDDLSSLLFSLMWGGYTERDTDILEFLGITYRTARLKESSGRKRFEVFRDDRWYEEHDFNPLIEWQSFKYGRATFVNELVNAIGSRWDGTVVDLSKDERRSEP